MTKKPKPAKPHHKGRIALFIAPKFVGFLDKKRNVWIAQSPKKDGQWKGWFIPLEKGEK